jgi:putative ABC transport system permease protein
MLYASLKSLLSHKLRLLLSSLAVILGVMAVSGAFMVTDTLSRSYKAMFGTVYDHIDVMISAKPTVDTGYTSAPQGIPASVVDRLRGVPGVADAVGSVTVDGARVVGRDGKVLTSLGAPRYGTNWAGEDDWVTLQSGRGPAADDEVAINGGLAKATGHRIGDRIDVLTLEPRRTFTVVGVFGYSGNRDSLAGETIVAFTTPAAQRLLLGGEGQYSEIVLERAPTVTPEALRDRVAAELGPRYRVQTGEELTGQIGEELDQGLRFFNYLLLGFAFVSLFVGVFLILNTFSIIVAQRMRELALMRAMGASRAQIVWSVELEALIVGTVSAAAGLLLGVGVGRALAWLYSTYLGGGVALAPFAVPAASWIAGLSVGIVVTLLAALVPALRASRIPPVAAMQESATADRSLARVTAGGAAVAVLSGVGIWAGLTDHAGAGNTLPALIVGLLLALTGAALLAPVLARPAASVLGGLFRWWAPGRLGGRNSARNPRRTAITAAALMIGVTLVTGINVVLTSVTTSLQHIMDRQVSADLIIAGEQTGPLPPTFDSTVLDRSARLPGVASVVGVYADVALLDGKQTTVAAVSDSVAMREMFGMTAKDGTLDHLGAGQLIVDEQTAQARQLRVGDTLPVQLTKGEARTFTVVGIYTRTPGVSGWITGPAEAANFRTADPSRGFIKTAEGASVADVQARVADLLAASPEATVSDRSGFVRQQTRSFDTVLAMVQILIALSIVIAVLGIVNTLALSVIERTREIGLLRAIGLRRAQAMGMLGVESLVISVFGTLLGLALGLGLGAAVARGLRDQGITSIGVPWAQMLVYLVLGSVIGLVASVLPAVRAARLNVLSAIAYE